MNLDFVLPYGDAHAAGTLIGKLRDAFKGAAKIFAAHRHRIRLILRKHTFVIRENFRLDCREEQPVSQLEK